MKIQPIVEGHGDEKAIPVLLRRFSDLSGLYAIEIGKPIRINKGHLIREDLLRKSVQLALRQPDCGSIFILFDGDDDCPKEIGPRVQAWAQSEARSIPTAVVVAQREFEAWFLAAMESLRGKRGIRSDAVSVADPESLRGAKERIERCRLPARRAQRPGYLERTDQPAFTAVFDMSSAYRACRSFRRAVRAFGFLAEGMGIPIAVWPPPDWEQDASAL
ncbi:MAG: DUF4276 family protein [Pirellulales bacterium]